MKKLLILVLLSPVLMFSQWVQKGNSIGVGKSISMNDEGSIVAVSNPVRVYQFSGSSWSQIGNTVDVYPPTDALRINKEGTVFIVGNNLSDGSSANTGLVQVFEYTGGSWVQKGTNIEGTSVFDELGYSVSINNEGSVIAVGAPQIDPVTFFDSPREGYVRLFEYLSGNWVQKGSDIIGPESGNKLGISVSLNGDGTIVAIGTVAGGTAGSVLIYEYTGGSWVQKGGNIVGEAAGDSSGKSISINDDGSVIAIGAELANAGGVTNSGHVRVYEYSGTAWTQVHSDIDGETEFGHLGSAVSLSSNGAILAVGEKDWGEASYGRVQVFIRTSSNWNLEKTFLGEDFFGQLGRAISLSSNGSTIAFSNSTGTEIHENTATISTRTWTGISSTDWTVSGNWNNGVPDNSFAVVIPNVTNKPIISSGTTYIIGNLTIDASSSLTLNAGKGLTVSGNLVNNGTMTVASDASTSGSLIVSGTSSGNITYNRYLESANSSKWHLIAAPVGAYSINTFATTGANNVATSGVNYSVTPYDNTGTLGSTTWNHWTTDGSGAGNVSGAGNFIAGKGYEILTTADGTVAFTGTVPVAQVSIGVTVSGSNAWNLIGNPFPSSIPANSNADATNNFITVNTLDLDDSFEALYLWDPGTSSYDIINQDSASTYIAPGQAFFVKSVTGGGTVDFTTAMRSHQSAVAFQKTETTAPPSITLSVANNTGKTRTTSIKYIAGKSLGLDPGFDVGRFGGSNSSFDIYTQLVNDNGVDFAHQVVPDNNYDTTVFPIGLEASVGTQITFKAQATGLPLGKKVFLEDKLLNTVTELNTTDKTYTLTLSTQEQGVGRFFLRTLDNLFTLGTTDIDKLRFTVISQPKRHSIRIIGNIEGTATLYIYDTLGRFIYTTTLKAQTDNKVTIPYMANGVYFVKIRTANGNYSTKIAWY